MIPRAGGGIWCLYADFITARCCCHLSVTLYFFHGIWLLTVGSEYTSFDNMISQLQLGRRGMLLSSGRTRKGRHHLLPCARLLINTCQPCFLNQDIPACETRFAIVKLLLEI